MNVPLSLPNPDEWMSPGAAGAALGVTPTTLGRMSEDGRLTRYKISGTITVYWCAQVDQLVLARKIAKTGASE